MKIGAYHILEELNSGGMATVYKGIQESLKRPVAIKVLHKKFAQDSQLVVRFKRESLIIARLTHPNIIHVIDRGLTATGMPYFVMDFVNGSDATALLQDKTFTTNKKIDLLIQVCKALAYAHKNGVIHRDIKPANILVDGEGNVLVTDFGIAQFFEDVDGEAQLQEEHVIMGTPAYMSPEQKSGTQTITAASDIYSLGVVMYELFVGSKPLADFKPPAEIDPKLPPNLSRLILRCLEADPLLRPASADLVKDALLEILQGAHIRETQKREAFRGVTKMEDTFTLLDVIKENRFGAVFLIRHKIQDRLMVVKRFNIPLGGFKDAQMLTTLKHENVINIYGVSGTEKEYIIVMEYLSGGSLSDRLVKIYAWNEALAVMRPVCRGMSFAHKNRIIHGNLRPSNILFSEGGTIKISDFGLSAHYLSDPQDSNWFIAKDQPKSRTADIYAAGVITYQMLTGDIPETKGEGIAPNQAFKELPRQVQHLVAKMLAQNPDLRFQTFDQVLAAIDDLLSSGLQEPAPLLETDSGSASAGRSVRSLFSLPGLRRIQVLLTLLLLSAGVLLFSHFGGDDLLANVQQIWRKILALIKG